MYILTPCERASVFWNVDSALYSGVDPTDGPTQHSSANSSGNSSRSSIGERATLVVLVARIDRGPADLAPGDVPVAVDVGADAAVAGHGRAVLAPQPRRRL